ncbi:hypothetical protein MKX03_007396 [Papaver bracteatum]|nr:hypothetical protein MKX03_007396 [Papaver bracteatum]
MVGGFGIYVKNTRTNDFDEWMKEFLKSEFFGTCLVHKDIKKNDINRFCIDCRKCICQHCIFSSSSPHYRHRNLQVRRYVYQNVVRFDNMHKYVNCSKIQQYTLNGAKAIFLNIRVQVKPSKPSNNGAYCKVCDRNLVDIQNQYCCIACKISDCGDISHEKSSLSYPIDQFNEISEDLNQGDPNQGDLNDDSSVDTDSNSEDYLVDKNGLKPKKQIHKRKGIPIRAPLY